jgi:hypothetical protein
MVKDVGLCALLADKFSVCAGACTLFQQASIPLGPKSPQLTLRPFSTMAFMLSGHVEHALAPVNDHQQQQQQRRQHSKEIKVISPSLGGPRWALEGWGTFWRPARAPAP